MNTNPTRASDTATAGPENLWTGILDSVKGTRGGIGTKQCIVLGAPRSGKTTLVQRISTRNGEAPTEEADSPLDLGMSYSVLEVKEHEASSSGEEDVLARLSIYQLPSPSPPFPSLLPLALSKDTLSDSLVIIVLDWDKPGTFVDQLESWIELLRTQISAAASIEPQVVDRARERVEHHVRSYREPMATNGTEVTASSSTTTTTIDAEAPLPSGTLVENLAIPIVVVCTKADSIDVLEREREFSEEQFDYIQQTLRTICLRYGASLFYTAQTLPNSFTKLRQYILHRLFPSPASAVGPLSLASQQLQAPSTTATTTSTTTRGGFGFQHRANVIDRDQTLIPSGWDSWGKIKILRETFDCDKTGRGWESDFEVRDQLRRGPPSGDSNVDGSVERAREGGLRNDFEMVIVDFEAEDTLKPANTTSSARSAIAPEAEQSFLQTHYLSLQSDVEKDPRLAFRQQQQAPLSSAAASSGARGSVARGGVVGPMSGQISDLPSVQGALGRASGSTGGGTGAAGDRAGTTSRTSALGMSRQGSSSMSLPSRSSVSTSATGASSAASSGTKPLPSSTATNGAGGAAGSAAGGNQVLADFFQSLLTARGSTASATGSGTASPTASAVPPLSVDSLRRPSASHDARDRGGDE
ncbi:hypothetical protein JCM3766R1_000760 [Sporobolomyces carnicolor]